VNFITQDRARFPAPVAATLLPPGLACLCPGREKRRRRLAKMNDAAVHRGVSRLCHRNAPAGADGEQAEPLL